MLLLSQCARGKPNGPVENQMNLWETQWTCWKPNGPVGNPTDLWETQMGLWEAQWTCGQPNGPVGNPMYSLVYIKNTCRLLPFAYDM